MDLLARREHSRLELQQKLGRRFKDHELIAEQIDRLADENLQSDMRMAEAFANARAGRGQGPLKIRAELRNKGVSDDLIADALCEVEADWYELAALAASKKFGELAPGTLGEDRKLLGRLSRFLQQRGFSYEHISAVTNG